MPTAVLGKMELLIFSKEYRPAVSQDVVSPQAMIPLVC
jgi:hypothetical protein